MRAALHHSSIGSIETTLRVRRGHLAHSAGGEMELGDRSAEGMGEGGALVGHEMIEKGISDPKPE